ncbi:MAG TPA: hypothetical protein VHX66_11370 [Solirubrobacteraceae bacterium]|nr:hypothetical protein [Solirubrobacteraceae bacterium]
MAPQRGIRMQQLVGPDVMEQLQTRSDEQLQNERKHKSIAYAILGARAAERYDAGAARSWFQKAMVASRHPQERMQIKRMADASLALAERRADDLKVAVERLGAEAPSSRALFGLRLMGLVVPPRSAGIAARLRGVGVAIVLVIAIVALGTGIMELVSLPFGRFSLPPAILLGVILDAVVLAILATWGRRKQKAARERSAAS